MRYIIEHTKLGFDWLDLLALIILLVVVIVWAVRRHNLKSEQKDLEDQLSDLYADDSLDVEEADGEKADSSDADQTERLDQRKTAQSERLDQRKTAQMRND